MIFELVSADFGCYSSDSEDILFITLYHSSILNGWRNRANSHCDYKHDNVCARVHVCVWLLMDSFRLWPFRLSHNKLTSLMWVGVDVFGFMFFFCTFLSSFHGTDTAVLPICDVEWAYTHIIVSILNSLKYMTSYWNLTKKI